jgi:hypothetical protein
MEAQCGSFVSGCLLALEPPVNCRPALGPLVDVHRDRMDPVGNRP